MEHVGPLAVSLQKALRVNNMQSEVAFVSAILSTLVRVLNEKSDEKNYFEIQPDQKSDQKKYSEIQTDHPAATVGENVPAGYESKPFVGEERPEVVFEITQKPEKPFENVAKTDQAEDNECEMDLEDVNSFDERNFNDDEKRYILESASRQIQTISRSLQNQEVICDLCGFSASKEKPFQEVRMHYMKVHSLCNLCGKQHSSENELKKHMEGFHRRGIDTFICNIDGCSHREKSLSEKGEVELKFRGLYVHMRHKHSTFKYSCNLCETKYALEQALKDHLTIEHAIIRSRLVRYPCPKCDKVFKNDFNMRAHMRVHAVYPPQNCKLCGYVAKYPANLRKHEIRVHEEKILKCDNCSFKAKNAATMEKHIENEHRKPTHFTCEICSYDTTRKKSLRVHLLVHSEIATQKCGTCDFKTKTRDSLKTHEKYHKPPQYICDTCEYTSHNQANFSTHKKTKHGNAEHKCSTCEKMFMYKRHLKKHESKHVSSLSEVKT